MSQIEQRTADLIDAILDSEPYKEFLEAKSRLSLDADKLTMTNQLRKRNFELQTHTDDDDFTEQLEQLSSEMEQCRQNEDVDSYLSAELRMCRILQDIFKEVVGRVDLDLDFLK